MDGTLVTFAIAAGVKLGSKINAVLIDATVERPLLLPVGNLYADIDFTRAREFFDRPENRHLVRPAQNGQPAGPYHGYSNDQLVLAYKTIRSINERLLPGGDVGDATEIITNLHKFEQYKESKAAPVRRILGTLVEIGIDYFAAHPEAMGRDSTARKVVHFFVAELRDTDFAEGKPRAVVSDLLGAALKTLDANITLVDDDARTQALLGGLTEGLIETVDTLSVAEQVDFEDLVKRIGTGLVRGAASTFEENIDLFLPEDDLAKPLVKSTLTQVLAGINGKENLFTSESLELIYKSALRAAGENAKLFSSEPFLQELIAQVVQALASTQGKKLFSPETTGAIVLAALEVLRDNVETLIDPDDPQEQLLASVVAAIAHSLANKILAGDGTVSGLLSKQQLESLVKIVFEEVAKHPEQLIGANADNPKMTAVAQIIGSVARALGEEPGKLVNGEGLVELVEIALQVATLNADKLIDFGTFGTTQNLIFKILQQIVTVINEGLDSRNLVSRDVFLEIVERVLRLVSANLELILGGEDELVLETVRRVLELTTGVLENRTNGDNLPDLIEEILRQVLWGELNLEDDAAVERAALAAVRAAA